ncbi:MAG: hypothetical protein AB7P76_10015 [Candidatus Melainabacteria bacterium]
MVSSVTTQAVHQAVRPAVQAGERLVAEITQQVVPTVTAHPTVGKVLSSTAVEIAKAPYRYFARPVELLLRMKDAASHDPAIRAQYVEKLKAYMGVFGLMAPVVDCLMNPVVMNARYKSKGMDRHDRWSLISQETTAQFVTVGIHVVSFVAGKFVAAFGFRNISSAAQRTLFSDIAGTIGSAVGFAVIRPILAATIFKSLLNKKKESGEMKTPANQPYFAAGSAASGMLRPNAFQVFERATAGAGGVA